MSVKRRREFLASARRLTDASQPTPELLNAHITAFNTLLNSMVVVPMAVMVLENEEAQQVIAMREAAKATMQ